MYIIIIIIIIIIINVYMKECEFIKGGHTLMLLAVTITSKDIRKNLTLITIALILTM